MDNTSASWSRSIAVASRPASRLRTCLYVEDSPADILLVEQLISRRNDLMLMTANAAQLGLEMARNHRPDIILLDINLPGASGLDVLAKLRTDRSTAQIPVSALSSNAYPSQIEQGLKNGFFRYLTKPFKIAEFMVVINDMLLHTNTLAMTPESQEVPPSSR